MSDSPGFRLSRETRLLLIVITLSVGVLLVLSQYRFPETPRAAATTGGATPLPLERLAARATYEELATIIAELARRVAPSVNVMRVETTDGRRFVPAVRMRPDLLLAHVSGDSRIVSLVDLQAPVDVAAYDAERELVLLRVPAEPLRVVRAASADPRTTVPRYVAAVEGTRGGPALRPLFLGRTDPVVDPRYPQGVLVLGGVLQASRGSLIFGLDGLFVGITLTDGGDAVGVPASALEAAVAAMLAPPPPPE